jgi:AraC-like DNA-binding protein
LTLRPLEYWQLAHHGKKNENPFCGLLAQQPSTLAVCLEAHDKMIRHTGDVPHTVTCPFGLTETAVPVKLGERTIAYLRVGQVLRRVPEPNELAKVRRKIVQCGVTFGKELRTAWEHNPLIPADKYKATVHLLSFFAQQLSALANQLMLEQRNVEPPLVQKAREYIETHQNEPLTLGAVAQAAGASVFHFCKVFRKTTGLTFTEYLGRARVEKARTQLLNPNRRISEVAFDVGFQSLTHFNRIFKRVFGQSPSEFRARLRGETKVSRVNRSTSPLRSAPNGNR